MPSLVRTAPPSVQERERIVGLLRAHAAEIRRRGVTRLALFGSTARGDAGPDRDVDLLVEIDPASRFGLFALLDLKDDLGALLGRPVDIAFADAMRPWLREAVLREAVEVL